MNYRLACMLEHSKGKPYSSHLAWLFRLEIVSIVDVNRGFTYVA